MTYRGRFAPSPTGPLHSGSLVSALASWLDARAHGGTWLVRIEDIDGPRTVPGAAEDILTTLDRFGMHADEPPVWQSRRFARYQTAFEQLKAAGLLYPCGCTRKEIADSLLHMHARNTTLAYPGTCRNGLHGKPARAWRLRVPDGDAAVITFEDRWQGKQTQNLATEVGDFVLRRADDQWAYQLAVVVDDTDAGITHIVRGADLMDSTARQIYLQRCLGVPTPEYLHVPVVTNDQGEKLSKQNGATALDHAKPLEALSAAARHLGLEMSGDKHVTLEGFYAAATTAWAERMGVRVQPN
ncbi:Glutamyl-Q tRNA(Asp) synthetase [Paraburkholderia domus]|uniref:Glutamyl-Q tRNA(Asp) synthetase n=1 Tax=Paraburkholderia domus TaxID=2793075 RepID=A0A9N8R3I8_9BURK|nr:tRNA glutamyl-Q(34) synthetase GluQRS [Paraburkholderia domus]MBK5049716.1 tRNA glutamyl-Q(34) synthetase GluQRS [Burkholderia sp. R-70006]MBK5059892.1 tRNA glutamyl-Q(34) synthetase GluQRS [Burkholderia sp. R-70199]MBK5087517.1 tRNA glutamyl-Q(34) synthetase GluQRS [Burkholderia sp. R-69927]MBK5121667.1 tRNA glutamyl-Q(34) synthetase GluQRS [Burkholderia sp. R-69980]MBK5167355.1 tRNA glutamyl-Q(34) synthetase GluQRS [Burkholderia sp. R-70211]MBK5181055.1 tRNA glutamyl-Q(34) synthetase Glu